MVLHVGTMKSGTSYLQSILRRNSPSLASNGILVPGRMVAAAADALGNKGKNRVMEIRGEWPRVLSQIEEWEGDQVIASHEFFGAASPTQAASVVESLRPHQVEVVVSARDLLRVIPSHWQTIVKSSRTITFSDYVRLLLGERQSDEPEEERLLTGFWQHHDVSRVVRTWAEPVGVDAVSLVTVPQPGADPTLLWERFATACGIDGSLYDATPDSQSNVSLSFSETEMLRRVNLALVGKMAPRQYRLHVNKQFANGILRDLGEIGSPSDKPGLSSSQLDLVSKRASCMVDDLAASGVRVVGDLADLRVDSPVGSDPDASPTPEEEVPAFAIAVIAKLLQSRAPHPASDEIPRRRKPKGGPGAGKGRQRRGSDEAAIGDDADLWDDSALSDGIE